MTGFPLFPKAAAQNTSPKVFPKPRINDPMTISLIEK